MHGGADEGGGQALACVIDCQRERGLNLWLKDVQV